MGGGHIFVSESVFCLICKHACVCEAGAGRATDSKEEEEEEECQVDDGRVCLAR